jgi:hypothetical protein
MDLHVAQSQEMLPLISALKSSAQDGQDERNMR